MICEACIILFITEKLIIFFIRKLKVVPFIIFVKLLSVVPLEKDFNHSEYDKTKRARNIIGHVHVLYLVSIFTLNPK